MEEPQHISDLPMISVVTASFNALDGLKATVDSVASQTFGVVEHVIVDGGSSDGTREYLESLGDRVRWTSEPDEGIADALNKGVAMARGDWIIVLQANDTFASADSAAMAASELAGADFVSFSVRFVHQGGREELLPARPLNLFAELRMLVPHQGLFTHAKVFRQVGGFDTNLPISMDYDHLLRAKRSGFVLKVVDQVVAIMPADGVSSRNNWRGRHALFADQFRTQMKNATGALHKVALLVFWAAFYPLYFTKWVLIPNRRIY